MTIIVADDDLIGQDGLFYAELTLLTGPMDTTKYVNNKYVLGHYYVPQGGSGIEYALNTYTGPYCRYEWITGVISWQTFWEIPAFPGDYAANSARVYISVTIEYKNII